MLATNTRGKGLVLHTHTKAPPHLLALCALAAIRAGWTFAAPALRGTLFSLQRRQAARKCHVRRALPSLESLSLPTISLPLPTISQAVWDDAIRTLLTTSIVWGVPALLLVLIIGSTARSFGAARAQRKAREDRVRRAKVTLGKPQGGKGIMKLFGDLSNDSDEDDIGAPREYLKVERLNDRLDSFAFSLQKATDAPATALAAARRRDLRRRFGEEIGSLGDEQLATLVKAEDEYKTEAKEAAQAVEDAVREVRLHALDEGADQAAAKEKGESTKAQGGMPPFRMFGPGDGLPDQEKLTRALLKSVSVEAAYLRKAATALGTASSEEQKGLFRLVSNTPFTWDPSVAPLELPHRAHAARADGAKAEGTGHAAAGGPPVWFVLKFFGDIQASQVDQLREEVTAVLGQAQPSRGDGVVLVLDSGGGTVTGYGLAATQLMRIKAAGLSLTVCVEQVAASGGYMMACVADRLVASPFAVLGSIGVITDIPNVYDRLKNEGIEFQTITAGKFKRTLTPTKKVTEEDKLKTQEDLVAIFNLFRGFVKENRPQLDLDQVATGEVWFGKDALERKLVDELTSSDDVLLKLRAKGAELYSVEYQPARRSPLGELLSAQGPKATSPLAWWAARLFEFAAGRPAGALGEAGVMPSLSSRPDQIFRAEEVSSKGLW